MYHLEDLHIWIDGLIVIKCCFKELLQVIFDVQEILYSPWFKHKGPFSTGHNFPHRRIVHHTGVKPRIGVAHHNRLVPHIAEVSHSRLVLPIAVASHNRVLPNIGVVPQWNSTSQRRIYILCELYVLNEEMFNYNGESQ